MTNFCSPHFGRSLEVFLSSSHLLRNVCFLCITFFSMLFFFQTCACAFLIPCKKGFANRPHDDILAARFDFFKMDDCTIFAYFHSVFRTQTHNNHGRAKLYIGCTITIPETMMTMITTTTTMTMRMRIAKLLTKKRER